MKGLTNAQKRAIKKYEKGEKFATSTFIDEDTITAGYGKINKKGEFALPLPNTIIKEIYGTTSWQDYHTNITYSDKLYPQLKDRVIPIKDMSAGYIRNQLQRIEHVQVNKEFIFALRAELRLKSVVKFKALLDE